MPDVESHKSKRGRSPSYPGIDLEAAIARAQTLYDRERRNASPMSAITAHWGYGSPTTGPAAVTYAALKKFGLLEESGKGQARMGKLTDLALDIILNPDAAARLAAIQTAALSPPIHAELWAKHKEDGLPSDGALRYELVRNRGFTENGASEFIREFRDTIAFAQLASAGTVGRETDEVEDDETPPPDPRQQRQQRRRREPKMTESDVLTYAVPVAAGTDVTIEGHFPLTEAEWTQFLAVLNAMKPGLVGKRQQATDDSFEG